MYYASSVVNVLGVLGPRSGDIFLRWCCARVPLLHVGSIVNVAGLLGVHCDDRDSVVVLR